MSLCRACFKMMTTEWILMKFHTNIMPLKATHNLQLFSSYIQVNNAVGTDL
jgi:hypothetical protein